MRYTQPRPKEVRTYSIQLVVEAAGVADWVSILHPSPQHCLCCPTVGALVVHTLEIGFLSQIKGGGGGGGGGGRGSPG